MKGLLEYRVIGGTQAYLGEQLSELAAAGWRVSHLATCVAHDSPQSRSWAVGVWLTVVLEREVSQR